MFGHLMEVLNVEIIRFSGSDPTKYMFQRKKATLIKKIWKFRKESKLATPTPDELKTFKSLLYSSLKHLSEDELHSLLKSVQSKGGIDTPCLCVGRVDGHGRGRKCYDFRHVFSKAFVYPELESSKSLRILNCCSSRSNTSGVCINPYHSSHVIQSDMPPPPYTELETSRCSTPRSRSTSLGDLSTESSSSDSELPLDLLHAAAAEDDGESSDEPLRQPSSHRRAARVLGGVLESSVEGLLESPLDELCGKHDETQELIWDTESPELVQRTRSHEERTCNSDCSYSSSKPLIEFSATSSSTSSACSSTSSDSSASSSASAGYHYGRQRGAGPWCKVLYYELRERIGRPFEVHDDCVNIFEDLPQGDGLCLAFLERGSQQEASTRVRRHIGYGLQLTREADGVWLYNRSQNVLFTGSPTIQLESLETSDPVVKRIPSGCSIKVFDPVLLDELHDRQHTETTLRSQLFCIRVSFAKGWGSNYKRRYIASCPCWVEVYLNDIYV